MSNLPSTRGEILATGNINPAFKQAVEDASYPAGSFFTIENLKEINEASLPLTQKKLEQNRARTITEYERFIAIDDTFRSRVVVCHRSDLPPGDRCPLIVFFHGGGHCVGSPETELPLARRLAQEHGAVVALPSYRLAPEHPFPASTMDSWAAVKYIALQSLQSQGPGSSLLPPQCDPSKGFIIAGTSAGANIAASLAHLARDQKLNPPLTGQALVAGTFISHNFVPARYEPFYLAREQNKDAPVLDLALYETFQGAFKPDHQSPLWAVFDQHHPLDQKPNDPTDIGVKHGHLGLPPAYFQICGLDIARDDSLIYERVLRDECGIRTRADLYAGYSHVWWAMYPDLEASKKRADDAVAGIGWLLKSQA